MKQPTRLGLSAELKKEWKRAPPAACAPPEKGYELGRKLRKDLKMNETADDAISAPTHPKFVFARGLCLYFLTTEFTYGGLLTSGHTALQQTTRAFAAEFPAPADKIKDLTDGKDASQALTASVARKLGVAPRLVEHQMRNHGRHTTAHGFCSYFAE